MLVNRSPPDIVDTLSGPVQGRINGTLSCVIQRPGNYSEIYRMCLSTFIHRLLLTNTNFLVWCFLKKKTYNIIHYATPTKVENLSSSAIFTRKQVDHPHSEMSAPLTLP